MDIRFSSTAARSLLGSNKRVLIRMKIDELALDLNLAGPNIKKLHGRPECCLRVQDWRIIFRVEEGVLWIDDVGPRSSIY